VNQVKTIKPKVTKKQTRKKKITNKHFFVFQSSFMNFIPSL